MVDALDRRIIHSLQCAPRAPFAVLAEVLGVSEQTVGRRYRRLRDEGVARVIGRVASAPASGRVFVVRLRCLPDRVIPVAEALARRPEATFVQLSAGGTEIVCLIRARTATRDDLLLERLPRASAVLDMAVYLAFHRYGTPGASDDWTGFPDGLDADQRHALNALRRPRSTSFVPPGPEDAPLLTALADDGRASYAMLAAATGWSQNHVAHRMGVLEQAGSLVLDVDVLPERLGFTTQAMLWLSASPRHLDELGATLAADSQVVFAAATTGPHNLVSTVICRDDEDLYRHLTATVATTPGITGYEISLTTRRLKQAGSLVVATGLRTAPTAR